MSILVLNAIHCVQRGWPIIWRHFSSFLHTLSRICLLHSLSKFKVTSQTWFCLFWRYYDGLKIVTCFFGQNCTTPPFGISLGWTSIILGCIPKHRKKFGMDPKLRPSQTPTIHPLRFFWHIPHSEPNWKTCVYLKSSFNQSGCGESESSFRCTL